MSNIPVKPAQPRDAIAKLPEAPSAQGEAAKEVAVTSDEALKVSVPRTQAKTSTAADPSATLDSLLHGLRSSEDASAAHAGLDVSRVFGLLDEE